MKTMKRIDKPFIAGGVRGILSIVMVPAIALLSGCQGSPAISDSSPLTVTIDQPQPEAGIDYTATPLTVIGKVSNPEAAVTVNGIAAEVSEDGYFSARIQLSNQNSVITVKAVLGDEVSRMKAVFISDPNVKVEVP